MDELAKGPDEPLDDNPPESSKKDKQCPFIF